MLKSHLVRSVLVATCILFTRSAIAGPLLSAEVTKIINRVSVIDPAKGSHPAAVREVIKDDLGVQTGVRSRSELLFQDNTLTRIGAETFFSFKTGTRDLTLEKGSMLLQVPKGLGGAKIHTGAVTAAITGTTIMMEYIPHSFLKVIVLEGSLRLSRNGTFGDSVTLRAGKMIIMPPEAKSVPEPIDINLQQTVRTSTLVNFSGSAPLPSMQLIQAAIDNQQNQLAKGHLVPTNLVVNHGNNVVIVSNDQLTKIHSIGSSSMNNNGATSANPRGNTSGLPANAAPIASNAISNGPDSSTNGPTNSGGIGGQVANALNNGFGPGPHNPAGPGGVGGQVTSTLFGGGGPPGITVAVSNSNQILGLLNSATSTSGGTIVVNPGAANIAATVVQQTPAGNNANGGNAPPLSNALSTVGNAPNGVLSAVGPPATTPAAGIFPNQAATNGHFPPGLGH